MFPHSMYLQPVLHQKRDNNFSIYNCRSCSRCLYWCREYSVKAVALYEAGHRIVRRKFLKNRISGRIASDPNYPSNSMTDNKWCIFYLLKKVKEFFCDRDDIRCDRAFVRFVLQAVAVADNRSILPAVASAFFRDGRNLFHRAEIHFDSLCSFFS